MPTSAVPAGSGSSLTERYVYAVTRRLPEDQRVDVGEELRGTIADRIDTLAADRPDADSRRTNDSPLRTSAIRTDSPPATPATGSI